MSIQEAKQELKSRGFIDPARDMTYKDAVRTKTSITSGNIGSKEDPKTPDNNSIKSESLNNSVPNNTVPLKNSFEALSEDDDETSAQEIDTEGNPIDTTRKKRNRNQTSPPKTKENSVISKRRMLKLNRPPSNTLDFDNVNPSPVHQSKFVHDVSPSPVFQSKFVNEISPSPVFPSRFSRNIETNKERQYSNCCECQRCVSISAPNIGPHHEQCGWHFCFLKDCRETKPLVKDKLINIIRNFLSKRDCTAKNLSYHPEECMCINHLRYYKENHITILDKFLEKQKYTSEHTSDNPTEINKEILNNEITSEEQPSRLPDID